MCLCLFRTLNLLVQVRLLKLAFFVTARLLNKVLIYLLLETQCELIYYKSRIYSCLLISPAIFLLYVFMDL